jgi:hypothetical protein
MKKIDMISPEKGVKSIPNSQDDFRSDSEYQGSSISSKKSNPRILYFRK